MPGFTVRPTRTLTALFLALSLGPSCGNPLRETVRVVFEGCREPQTGYITEGLSNLDPIGVQFRTNLTGDVPQVTVQCAELPRGTAATYTPGEDRIRYDPAQAGLLFEAQSVVNHDLVHWYVARRGAHPERAKYHACRFADDAEFCWLDVYSPNALMAPVQPVAGFDPGTEAVAVGSIPQTIPQWSDQQFFLWAAGPAR